MKSIDRRKFIRASGLAAGCVTLSVIPGLKEVISKHRVDSRVEDVVRLTPMPGVKYTKSFKALMKRAEFRSASHAIMSVGNQRVRYNLEIAPRGRNFSRFEFLDH